MCKSTVLPVVLYGCETWSLILREEHKLRVFENRLLRRIFGPKRNEAKGGWRNQQTSNNDQVQEDEVGRAYGTNGRERNGYRLLVGKSEG
jgi:hypothetical protein